MKRQIDTCILPEFDAIVTNFLYPSEGHSQRCVLQAIDLDANKAADRERKRNRIDETSQSSNYRSLILPPTAAAAAAAARDLY
jgi:hypothetical protein